MDVFVRLRIDYHHATESAFNASDNGFSDGGRLTNNWIDPSEGMLRLEHFGYEDLSNQSERDRRRGEERERLTSEGDAS
jgi:hypothetical protein